MNVQTFIDAVSDLIYGDSIAWQKDNGITDLFNILKDSISLPLHKKCPDCSVGVSPKEYLQGEFCRTCQNTSAVWMYYTPTQYKTITGRNWPDDAPIFYRWMESKIWHLSTIGKLHQDQIWEHPELFIVIANEAGKPPANYKGGK